MSHITSIRRSAAAVGVGALVALSLAGPAAARELSKPGPSPTTPSPADVRVWERSHPGLVQTSPSLADVRVWEAQHASESATTESATTPMTRGDQRVYELHYTPGAPANPGDSITRLASGGSSGPQYQQIALGALGGAALVGAAAAAAAATRHRRATRPTTA